MGSLPGWAETRAFQRGSVSRPQAASRARSRISGIRPKHCGCKMFEGELRPVVRCDNMKFMKKDPATREKLGIVRGTNNVFRDIGNDEADAGHLKAVLAGEIIKVLDRERLTVRGAHGRTGVAAADFSRIRNADLGRFTVDRLMSILNRLGSRIEVRVRVKAPERRAVPGAVRARGAAFVL